jgi:hypothetical protein
VGLEPAAARRIAAGPIFQWLTVRFVSSRMM